MKFATYKDASRDGQLLVVARDLLSAHYATGIANTLQQVLQDWNFMAPQLQDLYEQLNNGRARHAFPFEPERCMAPLPRAGQWVSSAAFTSHVERLRQAAQVDLPKNFSTEPLLYQGRSDGFSGPCDDMVVQEWAQDIDFEAAIAVISADLPMGATPERALDGVRLLLLANDLCLRRTMAAELASGAGWVGGKPATAFSPVAITPDEVGQGWSQGRLKLRLQSTLNGRKFGLCDAGADMRFHFGQLLSQLCKTRPVSAGSIIGSGPVSNQDSAQGFSCVAEKRAFETLQDGKAKTRFLKPGDSIRIEVKGANGQSLFGAIEQTLVALALD
ncbi:fumarylacetoacetate (FAA) hydrolase [Polaromonas sp.]|nr:fumarylacetoacetate (FAA) hydrolase [Polaromonas sp.]